MMPAAALMGANIKMPALERPTTTIQIQGVGQSFSVKRTSGAAGVFGA
jgi:hypothetical protein